MLIVEDGSGMALANSYNSLAELDAILDTGTPTIVARPHAEDWQERLDYQKERAAQAAFGVLNRLDWYGQRTTLGQAGAWPRVGMMNQYGDLEIPANVVPGAVKRAHALLARWLAQKDRFEAAEQAATTSSSSSGRSRTAAVGHPRNLSVIPAEALSEIAVFVNLTTAAVVRAA